MTQNSDLSAQMDALGRRARAAASVLSFAPAAAKTKALDAAADAPLAQLVPPHPAAANAERMGQRQAQLDLALQATADGRRAE